MIFPRRFAGKVAVVTGAAQGIGRTVALRIAHEGGGLALVDHSPLIEEVRHEAEAAGAEAIAIIADLETFTGATVAMDAARARFGHIDILVNNAGLTRDALALRMTDADWQAVIDVDLTAAFRLTRATLRGMVRRRHGRIIAVTSVVAVTGNPGQANYAAAKAAIIGMSKSIAAEVAGRGITVNCVAPGFIETAMTNKLPADQRLRLGAAIPAGRFGAPEDVAAAIVYLASAEAAYVTGHTLHVNGGMAMV